MVLTNHFLSSSSLQTHFDRHCKTISRRTFAGDPPPARSPSSSPPPPSTLSP
ncbi:hypothetical protein Scep_009650 [Stephania cephalantha]|uniref:Uncharacterized protein n=1 Tax=Stephania cephalantha TaxID=152367 RepID=A0AAP0JUE1_9MAGN